MVFQVAGVLIAVIGYFISPTVLLAGGFHERVSEGVKISGRIQDLLGSGYTIIVFDSGGMSRVSQVRKELKFRDALS